MFPRLHEALEMDLHQHEAQEGGLMNGRQFLCRGKVKA